MPAVPMRKKVMSWAVAGSPPSTAAPRPPSTAALRLINMATLPDWAAIRPRPVARRNDSRSVDANRSTESGPDLAMNDHVGSIVLVGRVAIDDDQSGALALGHARETCCRIDHERTAKDDEEITGHGLVLGARHL